MNQEQFVIEVQKVAMQSNPDLVNSTSYDDVLKELTELKDKAMRWEIIVSSFKPEPELFPVRKTLDKKEALREIEEEREHYRIMRARQAEQRQGQL